MDVLQRRARSLGTTISTCALQGAGCECKPKVCLLRSSSFSVNIVNEGICHEAQELRVVVLGQCSWARVLCKDTEK